MLTITDLHSVVHIKRLRAQGIERLLQTTIFRTLWHGANDEKKDLIFKACKALDREGLERIVRDTDPAAMTVTELRELAKIYKVPYYNTLTKAELVQWLKA